MLSKKLVLIVLTIGSCSAMRVKLSGLVIETQDNMLIEIPHQFVEHCTYLKNMIDEFSPTASSKGPLYVKEINGESLKTAIKLVEKKLKDFSTRVYELVIGNDLQKLDVLTLAHLLTTVNFLECNILFKEVLLNLCYKIEESIPLPRDLSVYQKLEEILPPDLQKIVQELLLIERRFISNFITISTPIKTVDYFRPIQLSYTYNPTKQFLMVSDPFSRMFVFDLSESPAKPLGTWESLVSFFSDSGKFLLILTKENIVLLNLITHEQCIIPKPDQQLCRFKFSDDSKFLLINDIMYDVETATATTEKQPSSPKSTQGRLAQQENIVDWLSKNNLIEYRDMFERHLELKKLLGKTNIHSILKHLQSKKKRCEIQVSGDAKYICVFQYRSKTGLKELYLIDVSDATEINEFMYLENIEKFAFNNSFLLVARNIAPLKTGDKSTVEIACFHFATKKWTQYSENDVYPHLSSVAFFGTEDNSFISRTRFNPFPEHSFSWHYYLKVLSELRKFHIEIPKDFTFNLYENIYFIDQNRILVNSDKQSCIVTIPFQFLMKNYSLTELLVLIAHKKKTDVLSMRSKTDEGIKS